MKFFLFFLFVANCFSQNIYMLVQDVSKKLIIADMKGSVKKRVQLPDNSIGINGKGNRVYLSGNKEIGEEILKATLAIFDLNGDLLRQTFIGYPSNDQIRSANSIFVFENRLFFTGAAQAYEEINDHGLFIATDLEGNTLGEFSLPESPTFSYFSGAVATQQYIYIVGIDEKPSLWILDHNYNFIKKEILSQKQGETTSINLINGMLYICGDEDGTAVVWNLDLNGNSINTFTFPSQIYDTCQTSNLVASNNLFYFSGFQKDSNDLDDIYYPTLWITDQFGNLISAKILGLNSDDVGAYPIAKNKNQIIYGSTLANEDLSYSNSNLLFMDLEGNLNNTVLVQPGNDNFFDGLYIPDFNFLYKSLNMFNPVKTQKGF